MQPLLTKIEFGFRTRLMCWASLFYILLLVYWPSLEAPFLYDDIPNIVHNEDFEHPGELDRLFASHSTSLQFDHRPLVGLITLANHQLSDLNVVAYRITNIIIHWLTAIIIGEFIIAYALRFGFANVRPFAVIVGFLWALHPLNSVTVIFISQRMESLMVLFYLLALYSLLKADQDSGNPLRWLTLTALSAIMCLASKEVGVSLIASLLLLDRMCNFRNWRELFRNRWKFHLSLIVIWATFIAWWSQGERIAELGGNELSHPWVYLKVQSNVIIHYIRLTLWPNGLVFVHQPITPSGLAEWLPHMMALCGACFLIFKVGKAHPWVIFPGLLFFIVLSPTSSVLPIPQEPAAEWRMYLPSACIIVFALAFGARHIPPLLGRNLTAATILLLGATLAICTSVRSLSYQTPIAIWSDTARKQPHNFKAWVNLGGAYLHKGRLREAEHCALILDQMAALQNDRYSLAASCQLRGRAKMEQGKDQEAEQYFLKGLEYYPHKDNLQHRSLLIDLGKTLLSQGKDTQAATVFKTALEMDPTNQELLGFLKKAENRKKAPQSRS